MDKLNKRKYRFQKESHLHNYLFCVSSTHERLFQIYERKHRKTKDIDHYIENMDESDKVVYEDNIFKDIQKFKG